MRARGLFSRLDREEATCSIERNLVVKRYASSYMEKRLIGVEAKRGAF